MNCEICGTETREFREGHSCGYICPNCGWGLATSLYEPYETDITKYTIIIRSNEANRSTIKAVSQIAGVNYLEAKRLLEEPESIIFTGLATDIIDKKKTLDDNKLFYKITPEFPY